MKKIYSIAAAVALVAAATATDAAAVTPQKGSRMGQITELKSVKNTLPKSQEAAKLAAKHGVKHNAASVSDVTGPYYSLYYYYDSDNYAWTTYTTPFEVEAGSTDGEVIINNFWDPGVSVVGQYDATDGVIYVPKQAVFTQGSYTAYLQTYTMDDDSNVTLSDDDMILYYDESDNTLMSVDYWGITAYGKSDEPTDDNCLGFYDYCMMMVCVPTNGSVSYTLESAEYTDNVVCEYSDNELTAENFGGYGMTVTFTIDQEAKTATATSQYITYEEDSAGNLYPFFMGDANGNLVVTGTISGDNNNIILIPSFTLVVDGTVYAEFSDCEFVTPFNLITETGVNAVSVEDATAPVEYFNLQGVKVANPENGFYIKRQGSNVSKTYIR